MEPSAPRTKRVKIDVACDTCRSRKVKCDGARPACSNCTRKLDLRNNCNYSHNTTLIGSRQSYSSAPDRLGQGPPMPIPPSSRQTFNHGQHQSNYARGTTVTNPGGPAYQRLDPREDVDTTTSGTTQSPAGTLNSRTTEDGSARSRPIGVSAISPSVIDSMTAVPDEGTSTHEFFGSSSAGSFTAQIKKALDARLGKAGSGGSGKSDQRFTSDPQSTHVRRTAPLDANYVLPARRQADHLMVLYWQYVDPLYPFLDRVKFEEAYHAIFAGTTTDVEEGVFVATLNVIFALSAQLWESTTPEQRDETSGQFFQRAQELLPLNIWLNGTIEQVQYLLLISQYLQSTDHPHQTWMTVGSAVRIAQGLGLHLPGASAKHSSVNHRELHRRIWHGCVLMDRVVAVTHGRPAMIPSHVAQRVPLPLIAQSSSGDGSVGILGNPVTHASFFVKSVELYDIMYRTILAVYNSDGGPLPKCVSNPHNREVSADDEDIAIVIQLDGSLRKWKQTLPEHLKLRSTEQRQMIVHRQAVILHIRFLHARLLLLRPLLTRFCIAQASDSPDHYDSLQSRVVEQSASLCVDTAKDLISVLLEYQTDDGTVGLLPAWWYRVYYVYTAATVLIAANLRPETFPATVLGTAWSQSMSVLKAHEKFGHSARRCVAALHMLSTKILQDSNGAVSGASSRAGTARVNGDDGMAPPAQTDFASNLLLQPVDEFPFAFDDFDQLQVGDFDFDTTNLAWLNDMHTAWGLLNER